MQDKLDDSEKAMQKLKKDKVKVDDDGVKDLIRYKDLLSLREKEVDSIKGDYRKLQKANDDLKIQIDRMDRDMREYKNSSMTSSIKNDAHKRNVAMAVGTLNEKSSTSAFEELSYHQNVDQYTYDQRSKPQTKVTSSHPSHQNSVNKTQLGYMTNDSNLTASDKNIELMRLKKEYNQMVRKESFKQKMGDDVYHESSKSPDRPMTQQNMSTSSHQYTSSTNNTFLSKQVGNPYQSSDNRSMSSKRNG